MGDEQAAESKKALHDEATQKARMKQVEEARKKARAEMEAKIQQDENEITSGLLKPKADNTTTAAPTDAPTEAPTAVVTQEPTSEPTAPAGAMSVKLKLGGVA